VINLYSDETINSALSKLKLVVFEDSEFAKYFFSKKITRSKG